MQRRTLLASVLAAPSALLTSAPAIATTKPRVVASFSLLADMVRVIAGDAAEVTSLVPANTDAHVYEPTPGDARRVAAAQLVIVNGLGFEGWLERLVRASGYRGPVLVASQGITPRRLGAAVDPHAWQSLAHAQRYVATIADALARIAPPQAGAIRQRAAAYDAQLAALDARAKAAFDAVPRDERRIVTSHDAFGYLGEAYGLTLLAPRGWSTEAEASARDMAALIRQLRKDKARALFVENISDRRLIDRIAQETGARVGGTLYADALSAPGTEADTYLRLYEHNVTAIPKALQAAPAR
jgi:zinc/manganese transport system substrate-binding protein